MRIPCLSSRLAVLYALAFAAAIALVPRTTAAGDTAPAAPGDALGVVASLREAGLRRDASLLDRLYAAEYFHTNPDGSILERADVLASYRAAPTFTFSSSAASEQRTIERADLAVVSEREELHGKTPEGYPFISSYRVTYVLERSGVSWRVLNSHSTLLGIDEHPPGSKK
jgi:ketosteroid isomerase-like protein